MEGKKQRHFQGHYQLSLCFGACSFQKVVFARFVLRVTCQQMSSAITFRLFFEVQSDLYSARNWHVRNLSLTLNEPFTPGNALARHGQYPHTPSGLGYMTWARESGLLAR